MEKGIFKGVFLTLGILSLFGVVFAVGFHTANEITTGTFLGNYIFNGEVDLSNATVIGNGSTTMNSGWPDAIKCYSGTTFRILLLTYGTTGSTKGYRMIHSNTDFHLIYNDDGSFSSGSNMQGYDCSDNSMSIQNLYDAEQAFNLMGNVGVD